MDREKQAITARNIAVGFLEKHYNGTPYRIHDNQLLVMVAEGKSAKLARDLPEAIRDWEDNQVKRDNPLPEDKRVIVSINPIKTVDGIRHTIFHFFAP